ncbi:TPA: hypothetical protein U0H29_001318 [Listeria monocytogenes]|nr:hypothetical protein [Listeria monocytogenes]
MQKQNVYKDDVYYKLLNKVRNHDDVTTNDLSTALWLYEKTNRDLQKAKNKYRKWTEAEIRSVWDGYMELAEEVE